jgi:hypothetical protein
VLFALKNALLPKRTVPLTLIGPVGFTGFLRALAGVLGDHLVRPGFEVRATELAPGDSYVEPAGDFVLEACAALHTDEALAYRVSGAWGALGYTGDTGPSRDVARLLAGCDVLVGECAIADPPAMGLHLSPALLRSTPSSPPSRRWATTAPIPGKQRTAVGLVGNDGKVDAAASRRSAACSR